MPPENLQSNFPQLIPQTQTYSDLVNQHQRSNTSVQSWEKMQCDQSCPRKSLLQPVKNLLK
ncbi:hypothetical protein T11_13438 [Trichinella zimbabwensis]|uniref:Uncharacterized protein n=1 Tax=Trichinella zimbabwensis TaxID=268475 RepID=A0A0V1H335_9BILA|nr:hypothetical protein T11_13438 [Trichinella zimbabwensis]